MKKAFFIFSIFVSLIVNFFANETTIWEQDFSNGGVPSHFSKGIEVIKGNSNFSHYMWLKSSKEGSGKILQPNWAKVIDNVEDKQIVTIEYYFRAITKTARYALLVNDNENRSIITLIQDGNNFRLAFPQGKWQDVAPLKLNEWHKIKYIINPICKTFDLFIDDMEMPIAENVGFRNDSKGVIGKIWTLGDEKNSSETNFAKIKIYEQNDKKIIYKNNFLLNSSSNSPLYENVLVDDNKNFKSALAVKTVNEDSSTKVKQGSFHFPVLNVNDFEKLSIDYYWKPINDKSRYTLLVSGPKGERIITGIIVDNKLKFFNGVKLDIVAKVNMGKWHHIVYKIDFAKNTFDIFVDDMQNAAATDLNFRSSINNKDISIWTLGNQDSESTTYFAKMQVYGENNQLFPAAIYGESPFFIAGAPSFLNFKAIDWNKLVDYKLIADKQEDNLENCSFKIARDAQNLYFKIPLNADESFEILLQPKENVKNYYHLSGNSAGAKLDKTPNTEWNYSINKKNNCEEALVTIPLEQFEANINDKTIWKFNVTKKNRLNKTIYSWKRESQSKDNDSLGSIIFPSSKQVILTGEKAFAEIKDRFYNFNDKLSSNIKKLKMLKNCETEDDIALKNNLIAQNSTLLKEYTTITNLNYLMQFTDKVENINYKVDNFISNIEFIRELFKKNTKEYDRGYVACVEDSMTRIPMHNYYGNKKQDITLNVAKNEAISFQIALLPRQNISIKSANISVGEVRDTANKIVKNITSQTYLVEYIKTAMSMDTQKYFGDLLHDGESFNIKQNVCAVPFWIDFKADKDTKAGKYFSTVTVSLNDLEKIEIPVTINVYDFSLPLKAALDTAFCFEDNWVKTFYKKETPKEQRKKYYKFILDHRLEPMNLWNKSDVDIGEEYFDFCEDNGKAMLFISIYNIADKAQKVKDLIAKYPKLRPIFFGHDEILMHGDAAGIATMKKEFSDAKKLFPNVPRLNTSEIDSRLVNYVDIWCPLFNYYKPKDAEERQKKGEKVWWYPTDYPLAPYANFNLDSDYICSRIIPWMTWKLNIDGLLYWAINREWETNGFWHKTVSDTTKKSRGLDWLTSDIEDKLNSGELQFPNIPWVPFFRSLDPKGTFISQTNGGGNLMYPGVNYETYPSIRLKNLRDGMQDYDYLAILSSNIKKLEDHKISSPDILKAKKLLEISDRVVTSDTIFTKNPKRLIDEKNSIAKAIELTNRLLEEI